MSTTFRTVTRSMAALVVGMGLASTLALAGCASAASTPATTTNTITVTATGSVDATPDVARITLAIETEGASATAAQKANGKPTSAVIDCLTSNGVDKAQIQTTYTDLSPVWDDEGNETDRYQMRTVLEVKGLPLEGLNELMEACAEAGATEISGPDYYVSSYDELYEQALTKAVEASKPKAEALAEASGVTLGSVVSVTEGYQDTSLRYKQANGAMEEAAVEDSLAPIEPGEVSVEAQVTVSYALR